MNYKSLTDNKQRRIQRIFKRKNSTNCPSRTKFTENKDYCKTVTKHIWSKYLESAENLRRSQKFKDLYEQRKEIIERVFADAKEKHGMRYTQYRVLTQVTKWGKLKFATMNFKKYAIHKDSYFDLFYFFPFSNLSLSSIAKSFSSSY